MVDAAAGGRRPVLPGEQVLRPDAVAGGRVGLPLLLGDQRRLVRAGVGVLFGGLGHRRLLSHAAARAACISHTRISAGPMCSDPLPARRGEPHRVALLQRARALQRHIAPGDEQMQVRRVGQGHRLSGLEPCGVQRRVAVGDPDRAVAVLRHPRGHRHERAGQQVGVDLALRVAGLDAVRVGHHPHLHEVHGVGVAVAREAPAVVLLRVQDAGAGAHPLRQPRVDHARVARGVLVHQRPAQHPGDDLHVAVRVGVEPGAGRDDVVVVHQQQPVVGVRGVVVAAERERVVRVEPGDAGGEAVGRAADVDRRSRHASTFRLWLHAQQSDRPTIPRSPARAENTSDGAAGSVIDVSIKPYHQTGRSPPCAGRKGRRVAWEF